MNSPVSKACDNKEQQPDESRILARKESPSSSRAGIGSEHEGEREHDVSNKTNDTNEHKMQQNMLEEETTSAIRADAQPAIMGTTGNTYTVPTALIPSENWPVQRSWPGKAFTLSRKIAKLHEKFFGVHAQLNLERDSMKPRLQHLSETLATLGQLLHQLLQQANVSEVDRKLLTEAYNQFAASRKSFEEQIQVVDDREQQVGQLLWRLATLEPELLQTVNTYFASGKDDQDDVTESWSLFSHSPSPKMRLLQDDEVDAFDDRQQLAEAEPLGRQPSDWESSEAGPTGFIAPFLPRDIHGRIPRFLRGIDWPKHKERFGPVLGQVEKLTRTREFIEDWVRKIPWGQPDPGGPDDSKVDISYPASEPDVVYVTRKADDVPAERLRRLSH